MNCQLGLYHIAILCILLTNCVCLTMRSRISTKYGTTLNVKRRSDEKSLRTSSEDTNNPFPIFSVSEQKSSDFDLENILQKPIDPFISSSSYNHSGTDENDNFQYLPQKLFMGSQKTTTNMPKPERKKFEDVKSEYTEINGHGYYKTVKRPMRKWEDARDICSSEESHLVIINSKDEAEALSHFYFENGIKSDITWHRFLVGLKKDESGYIKTVLGDPAESTGFNEWKRTSTDLNWVDRNCAMYDIDNGKLDTWPCSWPNTFICEHEV